MSTLHPRTLNLSVSLCAPSAAIFSSIRFSSDSTNSFTPTVASGSATHVSPRLERKPRPNLMSKVAITSVRSSGCCLSRRFPISSTEVHWASLGAVLSLCDQRRALVPQAHLFLQRGPWSLHADVSACCFEPGFAVHSYSTARQSSNKSHPGEQCYHSQPSVIEVSIWGIGFRLLASLANSRIPVQTPGIRFGPFDIWSMPTPARPIAQVFCSHEGLIP